MQHKIKENILIIVVRRLKIFVTCMIFMFNMTKNIHDNHVVKMGRVNFIHLWVRIVLECTLPLIRIFEEIWKKVQQKCVTHCTVVTGSAIIDFEFLAKTALFVYNLRGKDRKKWFLGHFLIKNGSVLMVVKVRMSI